MGELVKILTYEGYMSHFRVPEIGVSLSERVFKTAPSNQLETVGYHISGLARFAVYWLGRAIKEINVANTKLEKALQIEATDTTARKVLKHAGDVSGKIGLCLLAGATYFSFGLVNLVDLAGIALRALGIPSEPVATDKGESNVKAESALVADNAVAAEGQKDLPAGVLASCVTISYPAPKTVEA